jgi:hypothetical protein
MPAHKHQIITEPIKTDKEKEPMTSKEFIDKYLLDLQAQKDRLQNQINDITETIDSMSQKHNYEYAQQNVKDILLYERRKLSSKYFSKNQKPTTNETSEQQEQREKKINILKNNIKLFDD